MEFPKEFISKLVQDNTHDCNVIEVYCTDLKGESKVKKLVIVSKSTCGTKFGCILINSDNYPLINNTHHLRSLQLTASVTKYPDFLEYNSYFDCSDIKQRTIEEIEEILQKEPKRMIGKIDINDHKLICDALKSNKTLSAKIKKLFNLE